MTPRRGDFKCALGLLLALDFGQVGIVRNSRRRLRGESGERFASGKMSAGKQRIT